MGTKGAQSSLTIEHALNHIMHPYIISGTFLKYTRDIGLSGESDRLSARIPEAIDQRPREPTSAHRVKILLSEPLIEPVNIDAQSRV